MGGATNAASVFTAGIEMVGGVPQVTGAPNLNTNGTERIYTIWGRGLDGCGVAVMWVR